MLSSLSDLIHWTWTVYMAADRVVGRLSSMIWITYELSYMRSEGILSNSTSCRVQSPCTMSMYEVHVQRTSIWSMGSFFGFKWTHHAHLLVFHDNGYHACTVEFFSVLFDAASYNLYFAEKNVKYRLRQIYMNLSIPYAISTFHKYQQHWNRWYRSISLC